MKINEANQDLFTLLRKWHRARQQFHSTGKRAGLVESKQALEKRCELLWGPLKDD